MKVNIELAKELYEYTKVIGSHNRHIQGVALKLVRNLEELEKSEGSAEENKG